MIRTYTAERWRYLEASVESVLAQTLRPGELVLVVDHNPELAARARRQWSHAPVVVVENDRARGSAGAWNCGISAAQGELVAFIDDDAVASPGWLEQLTAPYTRPEVLGVGGAIIPTWLDGRPGWFPDEFGWVVGCTYLGMPTTVAPIRNLIGCNMSFRRNPLLETGGFSEDRGLGHMGGQPVGCDETELCIRLGRRYPRSVLLQHPEAAVYHQIPGSRSTFAYFLRRCRLEGRSKAIVARLTSTGEGLSSERAYTFSTLPRGALRGLTDALKGDRSGLARTGAIVAGLGITAASYAQMWLSLLAERDRAPGVGGRAVRPGQGPWPG
ncbi:MAG TPA: glycosyltransferase family 2 protein [Chloroflexaceae bacterium]|nr:glycosyltransferase family 2 protein [Chloroflexaceae bacterium]